MLPKVRANNPKPRPHPLPKATAISPAAALLQAAGEVRGEHILIIGSGALDIMCALLRKGAAAATMLRQGVRPEQRTAELALATGIDTMDHAESAITHARRALTTGGRVILATAVDPTRRLALAVARTLHMQGFSGVRIRTIGDRAVVAGELALFGPVARA